MGNHWQKQFGAARRAIDRKILAEAEAAIALEERLGAQTAKNERPPSAASVEAPEPINEEALRIARAFGRPLN
jgi:hypothetical protein